MERPVPFGQYRIKESSKFGRSLILQLVQQGIIEPSGKGGIQPHNIVGGAFGNGSRRRRTMILPLNASTQRRQPKSGHFQVSLYLDMFLMTDRCIIVSALLFQNIQNRLVPVHALNKMFL
jgi:hypothetical protein